MAANREPLTPIQRLLRILQIIRKEVALVYIYALFHGLIQLSLPLGIQAIIGFLFAGRVSASWGILLSIVVLGVVMSGLMQIMQLTITEYIQRKIFTLSAFEFAYRIPRIKQESIDKKYVPELVNRFFDTLSVQKGLAKLLSDFASASIQIVFGLLLLSLYHPIFIGFGLVLVALLYVIIRATGPAGLRASIEESGYKYEVAHWLEEVARVLGTFKLAGKTELPISRTDVLVSGYLDARRKHFRILRIQFGALVAFKTLVIGGLLAIGSILVLNAEINIGQFVAAEIIMIIIMNATEKLILQMEGVYDVLTSLEKLGMVTDLPLESEAGMTCENLQNSEGMSLILNDVCIPMDSGSRRSLNSVSFSVEPGEKLCIAGFNGSGKSTLLQLAGGIYQDFTGNVSYNNIPFRNYNTEQLRSVIGENLALEDLFNGTIAENISLGRDEIDTMDLIQTADMVRLSAYIRSLSDGFNTRVNPGDRRMPKSIVRKIILARSIVHKPRLLLLEDSLSMLDIEDRKFIIETLFVKGKWTVLVASNNREIIQACNKVLVLENGGVADIGEPAQILGSPRWSNLFHI
jgi:ABC-type bacteriocin/lantibiotic exporter with double-glycine peptidase domain